MGLNVCGIFLTQKNAYWVAIILCLQRTHYLNEHEGFCEIKRKG